MRTKVTFSNIMIGIISILAIVLFGFNKVENKKPITVYAVYVDGDKIGVVESKEEFEKYINNQEKILKEKYNIDKVYTPKGVEIKKIVTYNNDVNTEKDIYEKLVSYKTFTIKGYVISVSDPDAENKITKINVLDKKIFDEAIVTTVRAFVGNDKYESFKNNSQEEIVDLGSLIENIELKQNVTYKEDYISTDEIIFTDVDILTKYLLYGTMDEQGTYIVQSGDTISDIADKNKLNVDEFLIANPEFTSVNNLLYESQVVNVGLVDPIIDVVVEVHSVEEEAKRYEVEIKYDSNIIRGYEYVEKEGENGLYKVAKKYQYINGQLVDTINVSATEIKPAVNEILVKGEKYVPEVADLSYWAWPTEKPYTITSYFAYRWGTFHPAIDIYGPGYGSNIFAANNGVVEKSAYGDKSMGNYIIINHNVKKYYTIYMHLSSISVKQGQTVERGQKIGTMGNTGYVVPAPSPSNPYAGTHLHFGVYIGGPPYGGGSPVNPFNLY